MQAFSDRDEFEAIVKELTEVFAAVPDALTAKKPRPEDWSVKEIACHLIDSASNNHQRFTHLQRTARLTFPVYEAEGWVAAEKPNALPWPLLFGLFCQYNQFILHLVRTVNPNCLSHVWLVDGEERTLEFLMRDYYRHLGWHIEHLRRRLVEVSGT